MPGAIAGTSRRGQCRRPTWKGGGTPPGKEAVGPRLERAAEGNAGSTTTGTQKVGQRMEQLPTTNQKLVSDHGA